MQESNTIPPSRTQESGKDSLTSNEQSPHCSDKVYSREFIPDGEDSLSKIARQISSGSKVLDVGCGNGDLGEYLRNAKQCHVIGLDYSETALANAKNKLNETFVIDFNKTLISEIVTGDFDVIVFADILEHIMQPEQVLADAKKVLGKEGCMLISIPNAGYIGALLSLYNSEWEYREEGILDTTHVRFYTGHSLLNLIERAALHGRIVDRVLKDLTASEFTQRLDTLPDSVRNWLIAKPEGATYQFIAKVTNTPQAQESDHKNAVPLTIQHLTKLYIRSENEAFSESKTFFAHGVMGQINELIYDIGQTEIAACQFDFADRPGIYELYGIDIYEKNELVCALHSLESYQLSDSSSFSQSGLLPIKLVAFDEGAGVSFVLPETLSGEDLSIRIRLHAPISPSNLSFKPQVDATLFKEQQALLIDKLDRQFSQIEIMAKLYQEAVDFHQVLESKIQSLKAEISAREADLTRINAQLDDLQTLNMTTQSQLEDVLTSASWKMTQPLRWVKSTLSKNKN